MQVHEKGYHVVLIVAKGGSSEVAAISSCLHRETVTNMMVMGVEALIDTFDDAMRERS